MPYFWFFFKPLTICLFHIICTFSKITLCKEAFVHLYIYRHLFKLFGTTWPYMRFMYAMFTLEYMSFELEIDPPHIIIVSKQNKNRLCMFRPQWRFLILWHLNITLHLFQKRNLDRTNVSPKLRLFKKQTPGVYFMASSHLSKTFSLRHIPVSIHNFFNSKQSIAIKKYFVIHHSKKPPTLNTNMNYQFSIKLPILDLFQVLSLVTINIGIQF